MILIALICLQDNLYTYFAQRYKGDQVAYLATHDFLSGLVEYAGTSKVILYQ